MKHSSKLDGRQLYQNTKFQYFFRDLHDKITSIVSLVYTQIWLSVHRMSCTFWGKITISGGCPGVLGEDHVLSEWVRWGIARSAHALAVCRDDHVRSECPQRKFPRTRYGLGVFKENYIPSERVRMGIIRSVCAPAVFREDHVWAEGAQWSIARSGCR